MCIPFLYDVVCAVPEVVAHWLISFRDLGARVLDICTSGPNLNKSIAIYSHSVFRFARRRHLMLGRGWKTMPTHHWMLFGGPVI